MTHSANSSSSTLAKSCSTRMATLAWSIPLARIRDSLLLIAEAQAAAKRKDPSQEDVLRVERAMRRVDPMAWDTPGFAWPAIVDEARTMAD